MSNDLAIKEEALPVSADFLAEMSEDSLKNSGFETVSSKDVSIPYLSMLQATSPQCKRGTKVEGAEEGMFFNTVSNKVYAGPLKIILCAFKKAWVEWKPRDLGGGFVTEHQTDAILASTKKNDKGGDILPNGNSIVATGYHYCMLVNEDGTFERVVISLTSTQLKKSKKWLSIAMGIMIKVGEKMIRPPMFSQIYEVTSVPESNDKGQWSGWNIQNPVLITNADLYGAAKSFHDDVTKGLIEIKPLENEEPAPVNHTAADSNHL